MVKAVSKIREVSWRFGVTAASNESDNVEKSFLQLKLDLEEDGKTKDVFVEMTISEFYKFLHNY
ncbi:COMM domain-containing protein 7 [Dufourea novaeangliae]|uniref:COMM domain-containing protein 7 n=1 Tax=Dufourea novaeangliae TaxID=178035 RepID=A0A154P5K6_DUFNO|nr:COMM domain-containing protein 7 [Dufourea novaeangliae]